VALAKAQRVCGWQLIEAKENSVRRGLTGIFGVGLACVTCVFLISAGAEGYTTAKYIILMQGDGMGPEHVKAGGMFANGAAGTLIFESFPNRTTMTHNNASGHTTDSAASATAMATGVKVNNGVISVRLPGDGSDLTSLLELHKASGKSSGLITTSFVTDASPAAHGAHDPSRNSYAAIFSDYLYQSQPAVLCGAGGFGFDTALAQSNGYTLVTDRTGLLGLDPVTTTRVAGSFGNGLIPADGLAGRDPSLPTLPEMTRQALEILDNNPAGFYAFIEHEGSDEYSHAHNAEGLVRAVKEFGTAVQTAIDWVDNTATAADWSNTLLVVLADHETGGLTVTETHPLAGVVPALIWSTSDHTQTPVPVYARGAGAGQITGAVIDNTDIFSILRPSSPAAALPHTAMNGLVFSAFPNPGKDHMQFVLDLERSRRVKIVLFNLAGERVSTLEDALASGPGGMMRWDCSQVASGIYFAQVYLDGISAGQARVSVVR
jgi:alkaline phosphatase